MSPLELAAVDVLATIIGELVRRYGEPLVLAGLRRVLARHLTPEAIAQANAVADQVERAKFGAT